MTQAAGLLDILGVLIGFATVMLLLSMVVTALVQMTQSLLRIRGRNLRLGLATLMESAEIAPPPKKDKDAKKEPPRPGEKALAVADEILTSDALVHVGRDGSPFFGKVRSWIEVDEMVDALKGVDSDKIERARQLFPRMEKSLIKRFGVLMHYNSVAWALVVALVFQVNSFTLLQRLSQDPDYRELLVAESEAILQEAEPRIQRQAAYQDVTEEALLQLAEEFPDAAEALEEASGVGKTREEMIEELELVLPEDLPNRARVIARYEELLDASVSKRLQEAGEDLRFATARLSRFDIDPWGQGWAFYWSSGLRLGNVLGALVTATLLTLGAPFWFNMLRDLSNLRDALSGKKKNKQDTPSTEGTSNKS